MFFPLLLLNLLSLSLTNNECLLLYSNNTIDIPCKTNTSCCYIKISFKGGENFKCALKHNESDDNCDNYKGTIGAYGGDVIECDCATNYIPITVLIFIVVLNIF